MEALYATWIRLQHIQREQTRTKPTLSERRILKEGNIRWRKRFEAGNGTDNKEAGVGRFWVRRQRIVITPEERSVTMIPASLVSTSVGALDYFYMY